MTLATLKFKPGVDVESTALLSAASWNNSQLIRFRAGLPEKLGGWAHLNPVPLVGTGRGMHAWADLNGLPYIAVGTEQRLQLFSGGLMYDITPLRRSVDVTPNFSTTAGSPIVAVGDTVHGAAAGDWVYLVATVSVGGLILQGFYLVASVIDANTYTIVAASAATATVANGGAVPRFTTTLSLPKVDVLLANHGEAVGNLFTVQVSTTVGGITMFGSYQVISVTDANTFSIAPGPVASGAATASENAGNVRLRYLIPSGVISNTPLSGYGIGDYGAGDYGLSGSNSTADILPLRQWFLSNWGQDLIGNYTDGPLYFWQPPTATDNIAVPTGGQTPASMHSSFVSMPQQIAVALGAETGGIQDPNLVRWCDVADFTTWNATALNQAGSFRIPTGSRIVGGLQGPQFGFIWTDVDFWIMQYVQPPFVFGFNKVAGGTSLLAARAAGVYKSNVYWVSSDNFCVYDGNSVQVLACSVWDQFFFNINLAQKDKVFCAVNSFFNEVAWFFPSLNSTEIDSYVKFNIVENVWDYGTLTRTCWQDTNVFGPPIGVDTAGLMQQHEIGHDADGAPMTSWIQSGTLELAEGAEFTFIERIIGDFTMQGGIAPLNRVTVLLYPQNYPSDDPLPPHGPFPWSAEGPSYNIVRKRARGWAMRIQSTDLDVFWRLGGVRMLGSPSGKR